MDKQPAARAPAIELRADTLFMKTWDFGEANVIRQLLGSYGIHCRLVSHFPHTLLPLSANGLGEVRLLVAHDALREARGLIAEHRRHGFELLCGGKAPEDEAHGDAG
ncbi:MAG: DUF2007 domain-containing protein [bacterium]|nr:DUF2007 domain-containing protein [bacterium]